MYIFEKKNILTDSELDEYFEIEKTLYLKLFGEIKPSLKAKFCEKRKALFNNENYFNYKITCNKKLCGYVSLIIFEGKLYLYDITFANQYKGTRLIIETINFILNIKELQKFDRLHFAVDNRNDISLKTWLHLGAMVDKEYDTKSSYFITREAVEKYLKSVKR